MLLPRDAEPDIARPIATAGFFPEQFDAIAEGCNPKSIPVFAERIAQVEHNVRGKEKKFSPYLEVGRE